MASGNVDREAAAKARIISHMNADHQDSLIRYLQNYSGYSSLGARNARMTDITNSAMTIQSAGRTAVIPLEPPMKSLAEARERLVAMDKDATASLGLADVTIKEFQPPTRFGEVVIALTIVFIFVVFCRRANLEPGSFIYDTLLKGLPDPVLQFFRFAQLPTKWFMIIVHSSEACWMAWSRLRKYSVRVGSGPYWLWLIDCLVEGFQSFQRIDVLVERKRAQKKH